MIIILPEGQIITRAKRDLSQLSPIKPKEILFRHSSAIVGLILFLKEVGKAADASRVVGAARYVKSALAAECIIGNALLGEDGGMVDLDALDAHFDEVLDVFLLVVRMRDDGYAARGEDDLYAFLNVGSEVADSCFKLGLALLRGRECILDELRMLRVLVDALLFKDGEDLSVVVKIVAGEGVEHLLPGHTGAQRAVCERFLKEKVASLAVARGATLDQIAHCGMLGVKIVAEKMKSRAEPLSDELDSEHRVYSRLAAGNVKAVRALDGIVVGQNQRLVPDLLGDIDDRLGGKKAVRNIGMKMTVSKKRHFVPPKVVIHLIIAQNVEFCNKFLNSELLIAPFTFCRSYVII